MDNPFTQDGSIAHTHQCGLTSFGLLDYGCRHVWTHVSPRALSKAEYSKNHMCPVCKKGPWYELYKDPLAKQAET